MPAKTINKTEQRELDAHAKLRAEFAAAFADVESTDGAYVYDEAQKRAIPTELGKRLEAKRDRIDTRLEAAAAKLRKRGYVLEHADSKPTKEEEAAVSATADKPKPAQSVEFDWPTKPAELIVAYVTERASADADAPNKGLPFINDDGILRVRSEDWRNWLEAKGITPSKLEASKPWRDAGFSMKPYALPGEGRSHGFYTGPAPKGTAKLPRRKAQRAARAPRPFGRLTDAQRVVIDNALADYKPASDELKAAREELVAALVEAE
jgi:hypothetical protein